MQIHELPAGSPASGIQFAGDTGTQTQKIDYDALADAILNKLTTKTFDIKSESQTIIAALNALGDASKQGVANNLVTTAAGLVLDARQGKALNDSITSLNSSKLSKDAFSVITGTVTTSASGTAALSQTYSTAYWGCLAIMVTDASVGYMLIPYKYGDAAGGRWGLKALLSGNMTPLANTSVTYTAIMFRYTDVG